MTCKIVGITTFKCKLTATPSEKSGVDVSIIGRRLGRPTAIRRILVVEDELDLHLPMGKLLGKSSEVAFAKMDPTFGEDTMNQIKNGISNGNPFDMVIMDAGFDQQDNQGVHLTQRIREEFGFEGWMVAHSSRDDFNLEMVRVGADMILAKPTTYGRILDPVTIAELAYDALRLKRGDPFHLAALAPIPKGRALRSDEIVLSAWLPHNTLARISEGKSQMEIEDRIAMAISGATEVFGEEGLRELMNHFGKELFDHSAEGRSISSIISIIGAILQEAMRDEPRTFFSRSEIDALFKSEVLASYGAGRYLADGDDVAGALFTTTTDGDRLPVEKWSDLVNNLATSLISFTREIDEGDRDAELLEFYEQSGRKMKIVEDWIIYNAHRVFSIFKVA